MNGKLHSTIISLAGLLLLFLSTDTFAETVTVSVRNTQLRPKEDFLSRGTMLKHGDILSVVNENNGWLKVKTAAGKDGHVHRSAVTDRVLNLSADKKKIKSQGAGKDVVLASKGFDKEIEGKFSAQNKSFDFSAVDRVEKNTVTESEVANFIKEGKLK